MGTDRTVPGTALPGAQEHSTPTVAVVPAVMLSTKSNARPSHVPVPDWGTSLSTPRCWWHHQPSLFVCFLIRVRKRFSLMTAPGEEEATWLTVLSLCVGLKEKGRKKNCLCSPIFVSPFPSMRESQVDSQRSSVQPGTHGVPAEIERRKSPCVRFSSLLGTAGSKI